MKTAEKAYLEALKGINIKENEKIVLQSKKSHFCYIFARNVKDSNKEELFNIVLQSGNKYWINLFLETVKFNKEKFSDYLLFI